MLLGHLTDVQGDDFLVCMNQAVQGLARVGQVPDTAALHAIKKRLFGCVGEWPDALIPTLACNLAILGQLSADEVRLLYHEIVERVHGRGIAAAKGEQPRQGSKPRREFDASVVGYTQMYQAHMIAEMQLGERLLPAVLVRKGRDMWKQHACASTVSTMQQEVRNELLALPLTNVDAYEEYMA